MLLFLPPRPLTGEMLPYLSSFNCREESLNTWLRIKAARNEKSGASRTYIVQTPTGMVAGYFSLSSSNLCHADVKALFRRNMPNPIPVILLGRLAVDSRFERKGLGKSMLRTAILYAREASITIGVSALVTESISAEAKKFYLQNGFKEAVPESSLLLFPLHSATDSSQLPITSTTTTITSPLT